MQPMEPPSDPGATAVAEPEIWQVDDAAGDAITASVDVGQTDDVVLIYDTPREHQLARYLLSKHDELDAKPGQQSTKHSRTSRRNTGLCLAHAHVFW